MSEFPRGKKFDAIDEALDDAAGMGYETLADLIRDILINVEGCTKKDVLRVLKWRQNEGGFDYTYATDFLDHFSVEVR